MNDMPTELILGILRYLDVHTISRFSRTSFYNYGCCQRILSDGKVRYKRSCDIITKFWQYHRPYENEKNFRKFVKHNFYNILHKENQMILYDGGVCNNTIVKDIDVITIIKKLPKMKTELSLTESISFESGLIYGFRLEDKNIRSFKLYTLHISHIGTTYKVFLIKKYFLVQDPNKITVHFIFLPNPIWSIFTSSNLYMQINNKRCSEKKVCMYSSWINRSTTLKFHYKYYDGKIFKPPGRYLYQNGNIYLSGYNNPINE